MPKMYSLYSEASMLPRRMSQASESFRSSLASVSFGRRLTAATAAPPFDPDS